MDSSTMTDVTTITRVEYYRLKRQNDQLSLLSIAAQHLLEATDPQEMMRGLYEKISSYIDADASFNFMVHDADEDLFLEFSAGLPDDVKHLCSKLKFGQAICGRVAIEKHPITASHIQSSDEPMVQLVKGFGIRSYCCHPLMVGSRLLGTLSFASRRRDEFSSEEIEFLRTICHYVAMAKERLRLIKEAETEIKARKLAEEERGHLLEAERAARLAAEQASQMKDEFLSTLSHELRTPLNAILGWSQMLERRREDAHLIEQGVAVISRNARAQTKLIEDLLDMSRIISGKLNISMQPIDVAPVIKSAIESVLPSAAAKDLKIEKQINSDAGIILGDASRLQQVIWNVLANAVKFTPRGGKIEVLVTQKKSSVKIAVRDSGIGIKTEFLPFVFERFRQADGSITRRHGGLGIGLAIVKQLVELHGGTVEVDSAGENKGAMFTIFLPLSLEMLDHVASDQLENSVDENTGTFARDGASLDEIKVLYVDDELDARVLASRILEDQKATVFLASSAQEALQILRKEQPHVIVSDIGMPEMDGYEFIKTVRKLPANDGGQIPAAAMTAFARSEDRNAALHAGYQSHITKPVTPTALINLVADLSRK